MSLPSLKKKTKKTNDEKEGSTELPKAVLSLGSLNVRGCNKPEKREVIGEILNEKGLDVLALSETKLKGTGECLFGEMNAIKSGVKGREHAKEGVAILFSEEMWKCVKEYKCINSRILWVRMKVGRSNLFVVSAYGPGSEKSEEVREEFWENLNDCVKMCKTNEDLFVLGDLNARVGNNTDGKVIGNWGVPGINVSGQNLQEFCVENELMIGNTWFRKKRIHKYTWVRDNGADKALMDFVIVKQRMKIDLIDVNVYRGAAEGTNSDHFLVVAKWKLPEKYMGARKLEINERKVLNVRKLEEETVRNFYCESLRERYEKLEERVESCEKEWEVFKNAVYECTERACGSRKVGRKKRKLKRSDWWNDEIAKLVKEKKEKYNAWLQMRTNEKREVYRSICKEVKKEVKISKNRANEEWGRKVTQKFRENKKLFYKVVKEERKTKEQVVWKIKDKNGKVLEEKEKVKDRYKEYFNDLLNVKSDKPTEINTLGMNARKIGKCELNEISEEEIVNAIKSMKCEKSPGVDEITPEMLKDGGSVIVKWFKRLSNVCMNEGEVPRDWQKSIIVPLYKGKGDKTECGSYRGISLLSVPGKIYSRILIDRARSVTENVLEEEQSGFRKGRGCVDQVYALKSILEKLSEKQKVACMAFLDLEKAYDRVQRESLWEVLKIYGIGGKLLNAIKSFYKCSESCVRVCREESKWFEVKVGLRQGCVMSPWLFNVYMDGVVKEFKARITEKGISLKVGNDLVKVSCLLFADDTVLTAESEEQLQMFVNEFLSVCERRGLKLNVGKSKVMSTCDANEGELVIKMKDERMEEVKDFKYLGVEISANGGIECELEHRVTEARKSAGMLDRMWKNRGVSMEVKKRMYDSIVIPTVLYGSEAWTWSGKVGKKLNVLEMSCLRRMCDVSLRDRIRNEEIRRRCGVEKVLSIKGEESVLRFYGHLERMADERLTKKIHCANVEGGRARGRPKKRWMDGVNELINCRAVVSNLAGAEAKNFVNDRTKWRGFYLF